MNRQNRVQIPSEKHQEPTAADLAMDEFRKIFPSCNALVSDDGLSMNYRLPHLRSTMINLQRANEIISQQKLPLRATTRSLNYINHILHISYIQNHETIPA